MIIDQQATLSLLDRTSTSNISHKRKNRRKTLTLSTLLPTSILMQSWLVEYKSISFAHMSERFVNVSRRVTSYTYRKLKKKTSYLIQWNKKKFIITVAELVFLKIIIIINGWRRGVDKRCDQFIDVKCIHWKQKQKKIVRKDLAEQQILWIMLTVMAVPLNFSGHPNWTNFSSLWTIKKN